MFDGMIVENSGTMNIEDLNIEDLNIEDLCKKMSKYLFEQTKIPVKITNKQMLDLVECEPCGYPIDKTIIKETIADIKKKKIVNEKFIKLDDLTEDETINQKNIGSYIPRLEKADVVGLRSNMGTFKTQNLKPLMSKYKRIAVISFRVSLEQAYMDEFGQYGFKLYSDQNGAVIRGDRIVIQIDSLWKLRGEFDLIILDEIVYTLDHLISFVKAQNKRNVYDALVDYCTNTKKIIACDALLNNNTINFFKNLGKGALKGKTIHIVDNKWGSFSHLRAEIIQSNASQYIRMVFEQLEQGKNIFAPVNVKKVGEKLKLLVETKLPHIKVGLIASDTEPIPVSEWHNYNLMIITPTVVAGISMNDLHFHRRMPYFTNTSCSAEMGSQMIFRVRNTHENLIQVFIKQTYGWFDYKQESIELNLEERDKLIEINGINYSRSRDTIVKDEYYYFYVDYIMRVNLSKSKYSAVLGGILEHHGVKVNHQIKKIVKEKIDGVIQKETLKLHKTHKLEEAERVCKSKSIDADVAKKLTDKYHKTPDEKRELKKHNIITTFNPTVKGVSPGELTPPMVLDLSDKFKPYNNLTKLNTQSLIEYVESEVVKLNKKEEDNINPRPIVNDGTDGEYKEIMYHGSNVDRLHQNFNMLKILFVDEFVKKMGFDNIFDKKHIQAYDYHGAFEFLQEHGDRLAILFNRSKTKWSEIDPTDDKDRKKIFKL